MQQKYDQTAMNHLLNFVNNLISFGLLSLQNKLEEEADFGHFDQSCHIIRLYLTPVRLQTVSFLHCYFDEAFPHQKMKFERGFPRSLPREKMDNCIYFGNLADICQFTSQLLHLKGFQIAWKLCKCNTKTLFYHIITFSFDSKISAQKRIEKGFFEFFQDFGKFQIF